MCGLAAKRTARRGDARGAASRRCAAAGASDEWRGLFALGAPSWAKRRRVGEAARSEDAALVSSALSPHTSARPTLMASDIGLGDGYGATDVLVDRDIECSSKHQCSVATGPWACAALPAGILPPQAHRRGSAYD